MDIYILTCKVSNKYLHRLQKRLPSTSTDAPVVHRYGPINLFDTAERLQLVRTLYLLALDRAKIIA